MFWWVSWLAIERSVEYFFNIEDPFDDDFEFAVCSAPQGDRNFLQMAEPQQPKHIRTRPVERLFFERIPEFSGFCVKMVDSGLDVCDFANSVNLFAP